MPFENGKQVTDAPVERVPETSLTHTEPHTDAAEIAAELAVAPYREFFGDMTQEDKGKLDYILDQINPESKLQPDEVMGKIRSISAKFGDTGENRLDKVYRYLRLANTVHEHILGGI
jgi:hypothetical protein